MRPVLIIFAVLSLFFSGCSTQPPAPRRAVTTELKRVTQLDVTTNQPVKTWNARADTIHQHVTPPVGIRFIDADTGKEIRFDGTYKIESYRKSDSLPDEATVPNREPSPAATETH